MATNGRRYGRRSAMQSPSPPQQRSPYECQPVEVDSELRPTARSGHRIAVDDVNLYCFGGYNPLMDDQSTPFGLYKEMWKLSLATRRWTKLSCDECPSETASHSMILLGESLVVWGGTGFPFGLNCSNTLHAYHIPNRKWHILSTCGGQIPSKRYGQSMVYKDGALYVIGGTTGHNYNMNVHRLNLETLIWADITPRTTSGFEDDNTPAARYRHEMATSGSWIYVLGGGTAHETFAFDRIPSYNTFSKKWSMLQARACPRTASYPLARKFHSAVQYENYAYIYGGYDGTDMYDDMWRLDLGTLQWQCMLQRLPLKIYFHSSAVTSAGCLYIFGGVISADGETRTNSVSKIWLTLPRLEELVWDSLCQKYGKLFAGFDSPDARDRLLSAGIRLPPKFVERIN